MFRVKEKLSDKEYTVFATHINEKYETQFLIHFDGYQPYWNWVDADEYIPIG